MTPRPFKFLSLIFFFSPILTSGNFGEKYLITSKKHQIHRVYLPPPPQQPSSMLKHFLSRKPKCERDFDKAYSKWLDEIKHENYSKTEESSWVTPYLDETKRGFAILQRRRRLIEGPLIVPTQTKESELYRNPPAYSDIQSPPMDWKSEAKKDADELLELYWEHNSILHAMLLRKPRNIAIKGFDILTHHSDRNGRSYLWVKCRARCADEGGCCGRPCGCCAKSLLTYLCPSEQESARKTRYVYGHCTAECPCCIQTRHRPYLPHPSLPPPKF
ncbi:hypothetical protein BO70DRAFT_359738 [Aspergillus heteromorphus CBS 117.55]|uniref:Uncharacterized protein n=1 Tax=Aspergillus heteromorphus CBS 117.55 TaxID=1448321 RepID=A0A317WPF1_9EURO|nr:uncharacterized protein BO70DRAFT_359738 [Aspergillus heteromorphus CBS 117.55]PWY88293.1 hypothetical protein BO70DRAFT_359738 [Aspergillus heteromorphus CBS 117.55]